MKLTETKSTKQAYKVLARYKRFNQKYNMIFRPYWDSSLKYSIRKRLERRIEQMRRKEPGYNLEDYALSVAAGVVARSLGTDISKPNSGFTSWKPLLAQAPLGVQKFHADELEEVTRKIKNAAKFLGADLVGVCKFDLRWVYSHYVVNQSTCEIKRVKIPKEIGYTIVTGMEMSQEMIRTAPSAIAYAETSRIYSQLAVVSASLAEFIRGLGYQAIPCLNDTALSIPLAIDAGLGQLGRNGLLITPKFGPRVRLCKVFTNLPLKPDAPINFGVTEKCTDCKRCARECPTGAISFEDRASEGPTKSNNPGVLKWYIDPEKCWKHWTQVGTNCGICIAVCPFGNRQRN